MATEQQRTRAASWLFHYTRGHVGEALRIEADGPPIPPNHVVDAVMGELLAGRLVLLPMDPEPAITLREEMIARGDPDPR